MKSLWIKFISMPVWLKIFLLVMLFILIKFISMPFMLILFLIVMIGLTVSKCYIQKEEGEKINKTYRHITALISFFTCCTAVYYLYNTLPSPASPQINHLFFFGQGNLQQFRYCCEFEVRNDGETPCTLEEVKFDLDDDTKFKNAKTGQIRIASGGGRGGMYGSLYGGSRGGGYYDIGSSYFPQSLSKMNQGFCIMGQAENPKGATSEGNSISLDDVDKNLVIKFYFRTEGNTFVEKRTVPILHGTIQGMRF